MAAFDATRARASWSLALGAASAGAGALLATLGPDTGRAPYLTFWPMVMAAALLGGFRAGGAALALSALLAHGLFAPLHDAADWLALAVFLAGGGFVVGITELVLRDRGRAIAARDVQVARAHLAEIVDSSFDPILSKNLDGTITSWNAAASELFGYRSDEAVGRPIGLLIAPSLMHEEAEIVARLRRGERIDHHETTRLARDGRVVDVSLTISPVRNAAGAIVGASTIVRDISERKRADDALRQSEERLLAAADAAGLTYVQFGLESQRARVARNFGKVVGYAPRTPPGGGPLEDARLGMLAHVFDADRAAAGAMFDDMFAGVDGRLRFRVRGDDGVVRWFDGAWRPERGRDGKVAEVFATLLDVTAEVESRSALEAAKARADEILDSIGDGFYALDGEWRFTYFNRRAETLLGKPRDDVLGRSFLSVFPMVRDTELHRNYSAVMASGLPLDFEMVSPVMKAWVAFSAYPTREGGLSVYFRDVERRKAAEKALVAARAEAERANLAKSRFLASASHDLRQPVQTLVLLLALIGRQVRDNPQAVETARKMTRSLDGLHGLLTAILDISRLDAGVVRPSCEAVDLGPMLDDLAVQYADSAGARGLRLRVAPTRLHALADPTLLERALRNLLENALRYTENGAVLIGVRLRGERVRIDVVDTGIGVPDSRKDEIFEEFVQIGNPGRDLGQGLGLGLAIVARIATLIGARIELDSKPGRGSRFSLSLPRATVVRRAIETLPECAKAGGRLLVVEDNAVLLDSLKGLLGEWGYVTVGAVTGEEALEKAEAEGWRVDGVVSDHRLGSGLTGVETASELRRRSGRPIPTLILTGDTAIERISEIASSGFAILHKPVEADALRRKLTELLIG